MSSHEERRQFFDRAAASLDPEQEDVLRDFADFRRICEGVPEPEGQMEGALNRAALQAARLAITLCDAGDRDDLDLVLSAALDAFAAHRRIRQALRKRGGSP